MVYCSCGKGIDKIPDWMASIEVEFVCKECPNRQVKSIAAVRLEEPVELPTEVKVAVATLELLGEELAESIGLEIAVGDEPGAEVELAPEALESQPEARSDVESQPVEPVAAPKAAKPKPAKPAAVKEVKETKAAKPKVEKEAKSAKPVAEVKSERAKPKAKAAKPESPAKKAKPVKAKERK